MPSSPGAANGVPEEHRRPSKFWSNARMLGARPEDRQLDFPHLGSANDSLLRALNSDSARGQAPQRHLLFFDDDFAPVCPIFRIGSYPALHKSK